MPENEKKSPSIWTDSAFLFLLLTAMAFAGAQYYEMGFCTYFKIPPSYIEINLPSYASFVFGFLSFFALFSYVIDGFVGHLLAFINIKKQIGRIIAVLLFLSVSIYFLWKLIGYLGFIEVIPLLTVMVFGYGLLANRNRQNETYDIVKPQYSINVLLAKKTGKIAGPILIGSAFLCTMLFSLGHYRARTQVDFYSLPDGKTVLLKRYGDVSIWGELIDNKIAQIIIRNNPTDADTLALKALKNE